MTGKHAAPAAPRRRPRRATETSDLAGAIMRLHRAYGQRIADDPAALVHEQQLAESLRDATNHGIWLANRNPANRYSLTEIAAVTGRTKQAVSLRVQAGEKVHNRILAAAGGGILTRLGDLRRYRAERLAAAGVPDKSGSDRERAEYARLRAVGE